jgi:hypothetical protein
MIKKISIIITLFFIPFTYAQKEINVISSDSRSLVVEYIPGIDTTSTVINYEKYFQLNLDGGEYPVEPGQPAVPYSVVNVGVPSEIGNTIEILQSSYETITGKLLPLSQIKKEGDLPSFDFKPGPSYYEKQEKELVQFGEFGFLRDMPVQNLIINPVEYDPAIQQIKLYTKIIFRVNFPASQNVSKTQTEEKLLVNSTLNYNVSKNWVKPEANILTKVNSSSVLSNGKWYRFEAPEEGIYRITRSQLVNFGIDPAAVDPRTIKIYNNGGKQLPESTLIPVALDLVENAILVIGQDDGRFDESDYILFYGRGINFWRFDSLTGRIERNTNSYSKENYFWITSGGEVGKRMELKPSQQGEADFVQNTTPAFRFLEDEKINIVRSGRVFLGDEFNENNKSRSYMNRLDWKVSGTPIQYDFRFVNSDISMVNLRVEEQQHLLFNRNIFGRGNVPSDADYSVGNPVTERYILEADLPEDRSVLKFTFNGSGSASKGYLDFYEIRYTKSLFPTDDELIFHAPDTTAVLEYHLSNFSGSSDITVFDITTHSDVKVITSPLMVSGSEYKFRSAETKRGGGKYLALRSSRLKTPVNAVPMNNSNVHGIQPVKYIIITHKNFMQQALRLKEYREVSPTNPLSSAVVDIDDIYNEFGGGLKDVSAVRNFLKYAYDTWNPKPEYVLLFGDGDYDYKNIEGYGRNFIPAYHVYSAARETFWRNLHQIWSYPVEDYYVRVSGDDPFIDLAIGRLNIQTAADADRVINKIIKYEAESEKGSWRNLITLLADDAYKSSGYEGTLHISPSERIANIDVPDTYDINKIYMSSYLVEPTSLGRRKPAVTKAIIDAVNQGTVIFNFIGHGSPSIWTHEVVFDKSTTVPLFKNDKYFFLVAATCDFGYFDNPSEQSGTEILILKENSGAIGAFTASRPVFSFENELLAREFFQVMLRSPRTVNQMPLSLGQAYVKIRARKTSVNDLKFHLFGDPAVRLAVPQYPAEISKVNNSTTTQAVQIQALGKVNVEGFIKRDSVNIWEDYNGEGVLSVYDSYRMVGLLDVNFDIRVQGGLIYRGLVSVNNGRFAADFTVPKDISYEDRNGKISLYFYSPGTDGITATQNIFFNGTDTTAVNDGKGPVLDIFFDNPDYKNSYLISPNSELIVKLFDETGLNTTGTGVGHRLEGILNDRQDQPIDFSNYFTGDKDAGGRSGEVRYRFNDLAEGDYKIQVKAWDVFNNYSTKTEYFSVISSGDLELTEVYNYPNPFRESTVFTFQQNLKTSVDVKIRIYTLAGRQIKQIERYGINEGFVKVDWDGRDEDGNKIANGTYLYKVIVSGTNGEFSRSALGKLAVIY